MIPHKQIFCNTPWYELHIYWDGSLGICCQEDHKLYPGNGYNIATMSLLDWFNSQPVKDFRQQILADAPVSACRQCYIEEQHNGISRRIRSNQKSVIFTQAFNESFTQSPGHRHFLNSKINHGHTDTVPIDLHVDLGNFCNLACKMCNSQASSTIASQQVKWGNLDDRVYLGQDWTKNSQVWNRFKEQLLQLPGLNNIHFMGGETLLTNRFEDLVDTMIEAQRFDLGFSFVTNGTVFQPDLIEKLKRFRQVGMEISIETTGPHNAYQRQGTDTQLVLGNIKKYQQHANGSTITVSVRPAPSILTIGYHTELLEYCLQNKLIVKSNLCYDPEFLDPRILPADIKMLYLEKYQQFLQQLDNTTITNDSNFSDPNNYQGIAKLQAEMCMALLKTKTPNNSEHLLEQMVRHCERWDRLYNLDARSLYPEWQDIFKRYDYKV